MCPTRVSHKSVSYKSVLKIDRVFVFEDVFAFEFVGAILFFLFWGFPQTVPPSPLWTPMRLDL